MEVGSKKARNCAHHKSSSQHRSEKNQFTEATMVRIFKPGERIEIDYADGIEILDPVTGEVRKTQFFIGVLIEHLDLYKTLLLKVTEKGNWWPYIEFMLGVFAIQALKTQIGIAQLKAAKKEVKTLLFDLKDSRLRKNSISAGLDHIFLHPVTHAKFMKRELRIHWQTCAKYLRELAKMKILKEVKDGKYKFFRNQKAFDALVVKEK